jgi:WD40 repeat protein
LSTNLYFNRIGLAHRESTAQPANVKRAEKLLDDCPGELRNWEWHYLKRRRYQMPIELRDFGDHKVHCVAFSPNGRFLAAGGGDGKVRIWDANGPRLLRTLTNHTGYVASVAFSPANRDWIASAGADNRLRLWDWQAAREIQSWPSAIGKDYGLAHAIAFSPDGRRLAAPGTEASGEAIVHDLDSGGTAFTLGAHEEGARNAAFSPDGRWLVTGSGQGVVTLWNADTGEKEKQLGDKGAPIGGLAFASHPLRVVAVQFNGLIRIWDMATRQEPITYSIQEAQPTVGLAVHPSGSRLVTGGLDRLVTHSDPFTGQQVLVFRELKSGCYSLAFSPDGNRLAAASRDGSVFIWDARPLDGSEERSFRTMQFSPEELRGFDIAPNGRTIAIGGQTWTGTRGRASVELWSIPGFERLHELPGHGIVIFSLGYDPTGRFLASAGDEPVRPGRAKLKVWDVETKQEAFALEPFQTDERIFSSVFSPDGRWLVGGGNARKLRVWSASTGRTNGTLGGHLNEITKLALSPDGKLLASIGNDDVVKLWDGTRLDQPQPNPRRFHGLCGGFTDLLAFSPDSHRLAIVTSDDAMTIHRLDQAAEALELLASGHRPLALAFSPDGRWIASGGVDCTVRLWDATTGELRDTMRSHVDQVTRLRFLQRPESMWLISGSRDGTVKFWDMTGTERKLLPP